MIGRHRRTARPGSTRGDGEGHVSDDRARADHGVPPGQRDRRRRRLEPGRQERRAGARLRERQLCTWSRARGAAPSARRACWRRLVGLHLRPRWPATSTGNGTRPGRAEPNGWLYIVPEHDSGALGTPVRRTAVGSDVGPPSSAAPATSAATASGDVVVRARNGRSAILTGTAGGSFGPTLGWFAGAAGCKQAHRRPRCAAARRPTWSGTNATGTQLVVVPEQRAGQRCGAMLPEQPDRPRRQPGAQRRRLEPRRQGRHRSPARTRATGWCCARPGQRAVRRRVMMSDGLGPSRTSRASATSPATAAPTCRRDRHGPMTMFPGNGRTGFRAPVLAPATLRTFNQIGAGAGTRRRCRGSSFSAPDGSFVPFVGTHRRPTGAYDWVVGPGDVDGDGVADLVARDSERHAVAAARHLQRVRHRALHRLRLRRLHLHRLTAAPQPARGPLVLVTSGPRARPRRGAPAPASRRARAGQEGRHAVRRSPGAGR